MLSLLDQAAVSNHIWHTAHVPSNIAAWLCSLVNLPTYLPDGPDLHPPPPSSLEAMLSQYAT